MTQLRSLIDEDLVRRLVAEQFPQWSRLPVEAVQPGGQDNRTFRLGDELTVRLPSAEGSQVSRRPAPPATVGPAVSGTC